MKLVFIVTRIDFLTPWDTEGTTILMGVYDTQEKALAIQKELDCNCDIEEIELNKLVELKL